MNAEQNEIREFMVKAQQQTPPGPTMPPLEVRVGRLKWMAEELCELANAWGIEINVNNYGHATDNFMGVPLAPEQCQFTDPEEALIESYDATLDMMVFTVGNGVAMGTHLQPGWDEVHRSNMAKFGPGGYKRTDGKWCKPPDWKKPDLASIIRSQIEAARSQNKLAL